MRKSLFIIFVLLLSCDDNGSGQCGAFTPCGGAIVGTWRITAYCSNATSSSSAYCPGMTMTSHLQLNGTFTFAGGGTYSIATTANGTMDVTVPQSCLAGRTCAQLGTSMNPGSGGVSVSCQSNANGDCACTENLVNVPGAEQGTYTTAGSSLTMIKTGSGTSPSSNEYCVQGDTLTIHAIGSTTSGSATVVTTRQ